MSLIKNGKFFLPPTRSDEDFKTLFARVATAGVGRPVEKDGCPQGPWTADLLASAISEIAANRDGIELRTVQLWFEDNDKGISANNIRWLARVLGCNDPAASSAWQTELSAAQSRLVAKRRQQRRGDGRVMSDLEDPRAGGTAEGEPGIPEPHAGFGLARFTEALFTRGSALNLPAAVFAGAFALQFMSYFLSIHSVTYVREDMAAKQVGFLWAPNWTVLFSLLLPLYLALVADQVTQWKSLNRDRLFSDIDADDGPGTWMTRVEASSHTYWAVFLICVGFAGVFQWVSVRLLPLLQGGGNYAIDWGSLALVRPEQVGVPQLIAFTGVAYLYMCLCFYLLVAGLILLANLVDDFTQVRSLLARQRRDEVGQDADVMGTRLLRGIVRSTIVGLLIAICMKVQSLYLLTSAPGIWAWLVSDTSTLLIQLGQPVQWDEFSAPNQYSSLIVAGLMVAVHLYGTIRIGASGSAKTSTIRATVAVVILLAAYLLLGAFPGFSLLLGAGVLIACYGLWDPDFGFQHKQTRSQQHVL